MTSLFRTVAGAIGIAIVISHGWADAHAQTPARISQAIFVQLGEAQDLAETGDTEGAQLIVDRLLTRRLGDYELAQVLNVAGYVHYQAKRYEDAIASYQRLLALDGLPEELGRFTLKIVSQLSAVLERYENAVAYGERFLTLDATGDDGADVHLIVAESLYRLERYPEARQHASQARALLTGIGRPPRESLLQLLSAIHFATGDYPAMAEVLVDLIEVYPRDSYVLNLASIYGQLDQTDRQLALIEPLYETGRLDAESHLLTLANLYLLHNLPFKTARLLETEIQAGRISASRRNMELAAQAWQLALDDERAIPPLRRAAELADDGNADVSLAQTYLNVRRWREAEDALESALIKGGLRDPGNAHLMLGMTRFSLGRYEQAIAAFREAARHGPSEAAALQWIRYARQEEERRAVLQGSGA